MKHLINLGGWITVENPLYIHTNTQNWRLFHPQSLHCWDTKWILWQRILNPQRRFGLWCFVKASLPCRYHGSDGGHIKMVASTVQGCRPLRCERETPTQRDLYTGNLNLTLINKTKRLFTPKNSNTGSFTYEGQSIIYTHSKGWQGCNKSLVFPQLQVYHFSFTGDSGSAPTSQIHLQDWGAGLLTEWHVKKGEGRRERRWKT